MDRKTLIAMGAGLALSLSGASAFADSHANMQANTMQSGYSNHAKAEGKCGMAKCGSQADKKAHDGKCGADFKATDGKCGAKASDGKCGANKAKASDGKCGATKADTSTKKAGGKCGTAKCGASK